MKVATEHLKFIDAYPELAAKYAQKLHIKKDEIPFVRKFYTSEKSETVKGERAIVSYITTNMRDRDGEVLLPSGMRSENYEKSGKPVFWGHKYSDPSHIVGQNLWLKKDPKGDGIIAKTAFRKNQFADEVYNLYTEEVVKGEGPVLKAWSVGFIPIDWIDGDGKKSPKRTYKEWEILEYSAVPIGSNPGAISLAYQKGLITTNRLKKDFEVEIVDESEEIEIVDSPDGETEDIIEIEFSEEKADEANMVKCSKCGKEFDFGKQPEIASGGVKCPHCGAIVNQEGKALEEIVTKPETTENYHRIPVNSGHDGHKLRTKTISSGKGIKGIYCVDHKVFMTVLFDVDKWTMAEAKKWISEHRDSLKTYEGVIQKGWFKKERWNGSLPTDFDIARLEVGPAGFEYAVYEKYLDCKVKEIFLSGWSIPSPLLGNGLSACKEVFKEFDLQAIRNFTYDGKELPPNYSVIQLTSKRSDDFLIDGTCFYMANGTPFIIKYIPDWRGIYVRIVTAEKDKCFGKELIARVKTWAKEHNLLKGEKFALTGEFLSKSEDDWGNLKIEAKVRDSIEKSTNALMKKGMNFDSRGLLFIGKPGTGKTMTGRILLNKLDATFIWISSKDLQRMPTGYALALGFELARDLAPSVLFIEDVDAWIGGYSSTVDLLKTEMDGLKQNKGMITILTSNFPELLPDALLDRPGRFHHVIDFKLPTKQHREEMLADWAGDIDSETLGKILSKTDGFSGAHMKELVDFAKMIADEDDIDISKALLRSLERLMEQKELINEIRNNKTDKSIEAFKGKMKTMAKTDIEIKDVSVDTGGIDDTVEANETEETASKEEDEFEIEEIEEVDESEEASTVVVIDGIFQQIPIQILHDPDVETDSEAFEKFLKETLEIEAEEEEVTEVVKDPEKPSILELGIAEIKEQLAELKEGRTLSTKNRTLVKKIMDGIQSLFTELEKLYAATEPQPKDEHIVSMEKEDEIEIKEEIEIEEKEDHVEMPEITIEALKGILTDLITPETVKEAVKEAVKTELDKQRGKVA